MNEAFLFPLLVLLAPPVTVNTQKNLELKARQDHERGSNALETLLSANISARIPNAQSDNLNRTIGTSCTEQLSLLLEELMNGSTWALQMIDASSKIPVGILKGNAIDLGMFDECVNIRVNEDGQEIRGRHCMYNVMTELAGLPISETLSICLPASCEPEDVQRIVKGALELIEELVDMDIPISVGKTTCTSVDPSEWTVGGIVTLFPMVSSMFSTGFSLLLLFLVVCTACDVFTRYSSEKLRTNYGIDTLCQFSLRSSAVRVLSTKSSPEALPVLQGLRFYSMCWVILNHTHMMSVIQPSMNPIDIGQWNPTWRSLYMELSVFAADTFFAINGFLMTHIFLKDMSTGRSFNLFSYYIHRYIRLTPAYAALILSTLYIFPHLGSGPLWESRTDYEVQDCRKSWWTMLLYVQNYAGVTNYGCVSHTWYLNVDMHFFWISPLILYPLAKKPKVGLCILAAFFIASVATNVKIAYDNKYSSVIIWLEQLTGTYMEKFYFKSHVRAGPWLIGIFFGYLHFTGKGSSTSKAVKWIGWLLTVAVFLIIVITTRASEEKDYNYNIVWESIYTAVAKPAWGFAVSWIIYSSVRGFGGPLSTFLSFSIYNPLSRLCYCTYLIHYQILYMKWRSTRTGYYFSPFNEFNRYLSDFLMSLIVGFFFNLVFETPFMLLEKIITKRSKRSKADSKKTLDLHEVEKGFDNSSLKPS